MPRMTSLSGVQIAEICRLREDEDLTHGQIGAIVGCSEQQSRWHCREQGAWGPRDVIEFRRRARWEKPATRGGRPVVPFTADEEALLLEHTGIESPNYSAIGRQLGRNPGSVRAHFHVLARRQAIAEEIGSC